ncbi:hypothetical protein [Streptomyces sp. NPDC044948]|uniref:hypothetical protein n=1 Tax=Streptomyces sp. NPDC044948 TaxID=3157092 RepID=UPI0033C49E47
MAEERQKSAVLGLGVLRVVEGAPQDLEEVRVGRTREGDVAGVELGDGEEGDRAVGPRAARLDPLQDVQFLRGPLGCPGVEVQALGRCGADPAHEPDVVR